MHSWQGVLNISTIKDKTEVKEIKDCPELQELQVDDDHPTDELKETKSVYQIMSIDKVEKFLKCDKCFKEILQSKSIYAHCENCGQYTHVSQCLRDVCAKLIIKADGEETL